MHQNANRSDVADTTWTARIRPVLLVLGGFLFYVLLLGLRGTGSAGMGLTTRLHTANEALLGAAPLDWLASPHPIVDLLAIPIAAVTDNDVLAFAIISAAAVALALPAIWQMAEAVAGWIGAALASGLFLGFPIIAGTATAAGEASIVLLMWCWLLRLTSLSRTRWWTTAILVVLAGAMALSWAPVLLWLPAWLVTVICAKSLTKRGADWQESGMTAPMGVPVALVVAPVAAVVLPMILFVIIGVPIEGLPTAWKTYLTHSIFADWPPVMLAGEVFDPARPPLTTGLIWTAFEFPPEVVLAAIGALILPATRHFGIFMKSPPRVQGFALPRSFSVMTLAFLLGLPWALRTRAMGDVPTPLLAAPLLAILAGTLLSSIGRIVIEQLEGRRLSASVRNGAVAALLGIFLLPGLVSTVLIHPFEESYYNVFAGSVEGAIEAGYPASRDDVLPVEVARSVAQRVGDRPLYAGPWQSHFEAYTAAGAIGRLNFTDDPDDWQAHFSERNAHPEKIENEPPRQITWGPEDTAVFVLDIR